jgi:hypothetical protein
MSDQEREQQLIPPADEYVESLIERTNVSVGLSDGLFIGMGIVLMLAPFKLFDDWNQRTLIGKAGALVVSPLLLVPVVVGALAFLVGACIYATRLVPAYLYRSYRARAFKNGGDTR